MSGVIPSVPGAITNNNCHTITDVLTPFAGYWLLEEVKLGVLSFSHCYLRVSWLCKGEGDLLPNVDLIEASVSSVF